MPNSNRAHRRTPTTAEAAFTAQREAIRLALVELHLLITDLPEYTAQHQNRYGIRCPATEAQVVTTGQEQWCTLDPESLRATTNGWDGLGDITGPEYVICLSCNRDFRKPERPPLGLSITQQYMR